jgi:hypothetical protein
MPKLMSRFLEAHPFDEPKREQTKEHFAAIAFEDGRKAFSDLKIMALPKNMIISLRVPCYKTTEEVHAWRDGFRQEEHDHDDVIRFTNVGAR